MKETVKHGGCGGTVNITVLGYTSVFQMSFFIELKSKLFCNRGVFSWSRTMGGMIETEYLVKLHTFTGKSGNTVANLPHEPGV